MAAAWVATKRLEGTNQITKTCGDFVTYLMIVWLFTYSDMKTILFPQSVFGILSASSAHLFGQPHEALSCAASLNRLPTTLLWTYSTLLPFNIFNQTSPGAIAEDLTNKPWRPLPARRISQENAQTLMYVFYTNNLALSLLIGGFRQSLILLVLGVWYNAFGGADAGWIVRNLINAFGFVAFASGAMEVSLSKPLVLTPELLSWFCVIAAIVFCTVQTQDMYDMKGDALRGRRTMPLVLGNWRTRLLTAQSVIFFSVYCPYYWKSTNECYIFSGAVGIVIALRSLTARSVEADKRTFQIWNLWLVLMYSLPSLSGKMT